MRRIKIAVVDDNDADRTQLASYIKESARELNCDVSISAYSLGENFLEDEDLSVLDAVFLDIYMGLQNGMEVAKDLRHRDYQGIIIFCTSTAHFALEGYSVKAMDYILKPFNYERISKQIKDILKKLGEGNRSIRVKDGRQWYKVNLCDILYIEKQGNYVQIHTIRKTYCMRTALGEMEGQLLRYDCFVKCDRGVIVNLENIEELQDDTVLLKHNIRVPISRNHRPLIGDRYFDFIFKRME